LNTVAALATLAIIWLGEWVLWFRPVKPSNFTLIPIISGFVIVYYIEKTPIVLPLEFPQTSINTSS